MRQDGVACSYMACAFVWQFFTVPDSGCDSVVGPSHAQGKETTEVGCALLEGELQLGRVGSADLLPWRQVLSTGVTSLLFSHSLPPSKHQPTCAPVYLYMHTSTSIHLPVHACTPPRPHTHPSMHAHISALRHPSMHLCTLIHLCPPAPTHWVSI